VVLTIPTLEGESLEEYSIKVAEAWKVGWKGSDNGVILLIAGKEHKIRIEVGRDLRGGLQTWFPAVSYGMKLPRVLRQEILMAASPQAWRP